MSNSKYAALAATMEHGSLTRAASALGYTQSGVSHLIRALEQDVGFSLLKRSKSGVELTPEGKRLMPYIQQILTAEKDMQRLCEELRGVSTGQLTVGTFSSAARGLRQAKLAFSISTIAGSAAGAGGAGCCAVSSGRGSTRMASGARCSP